MLQNGPITSTPTTRASEVLRAVEYLLAERLPRGWTADLEPAPRIAAKLADARLTITAPDGERVVLIVEAKVTVTPREVGDLIRSANRLTVDLGGKGEERGRPLIAARFLSLRVKERLVERDMNYVDMTGNVRVSLSRPGLFVETEGATRDPVPEKRAIRSLRGPAAACIVRALWESEPPVGIRELAQAAGVSPGTVSRILDLLRREDIVNPERGPVESLDRAALIERWAEDYAFTVQNTTSLFLEPRSLDVLLDKLPTAGFPYAVTGSLAARIVDEYAKAKLAMIYVEDIDRAADELRLTPVASGGNVLLAEPFNPIAFENGWERDGVRYANLGQVAADLLGSPGRGPEEGEQLLRTLTSGAHG